MSGPHRALQVRALSAGVCALLLAGCGGGGGSGGNPRGAASVKDNFSKVSTGMTVVQVEELLGPGTLFQGSGLEKFAPADKSRFSVRTWEEDDTRYQVAFLDDKVLHTESSPKEKPKPVTPSKVTKENYDKLKLGMTRKDVDAILGHGGKVESTTTVTGVKGQKVFWRDGKKFIQVLFEDGKVTAMIPKDL